MEGREVKPAAFNGGIFLLVVLLILGSMSLDSMTSMVLGVTGGLVGCVVGAYFTIKKARSRAERVFWMQATAAILLLVVPFAALWLLVPGWYRLLLFIPYGIGLFLLVRYSNRRLAKVQGQQRELARSHD